MFLLKTRSLQVIRLSIYAKSACFIWFCNVFVQMLPVKIVNFIIIIPLNLDVSVLFSQFVLRKILKNKNRMSFREVQVQCERGKIFHFLMCHNTDNSRLLFKNQQVCNMNLTHTFMLNNRTIWLSLGLSEMMLIKYSYRKQE